MIKVLVADDHTLIREGIKHILKEQPDMMVIGEARNGEEALRLVHTSDWDVLVMDISMPLRSGMEVLKDVQNTRPHALVLMLSVYPENQFGIRVIKAGAAGYLTKSAAVEELVPAIRKIYSGGKYVSPTLAEQFVEELSGNAPKVPHKQLSDREFNVLCMVGAGKSNSLIAQELALSTKTVSTYRQRVLHKLGLRNNADLKMNKTHSIGRVADEALPHNWGIHSKRLTYRAAFALS